KARRQILDGLRGLPARRDRLELSFSNVFRDRGLQAAETEVGHDAAEALVNLYLRRDDRRQHLPTVAHDGRGGLVAGAFDAEHEHCNYELNRAERPSLKKH